MGVIYKLKPEIRDFILKEKENRPNISCRKFSTLIAEKFHLKISKSQINSVIKTAGLSSPVGRRPKPKRLTQEAEGLGVFILKAADSLLGGVYYIVEAIKNRLKQKKDLYSLTEALVYLPLFDQGNKPDSGLWKLINKKYTLDDLSLYLNELQAVTALNSDIIQIIPRIFKEILFLRINFSDGGTFYLDGQFNTLWSTPNIPFDFSTTNYKIKSYINKYFIEASPLVLFTAPGYDLFPKEWFDFLVRLDTPGKRIVEIDLLGTKLEELEVIPISEPNNCFLVFGLWPWQHTKYRKTESLGDFKPFNFVPLKKDFYLADAIIKLSQPNTNQSFTLRGVFLKQSLDAKPDLAILSNIPQEKASSEDIASLYLNRWPNLQAGFKEFSRKIELFTYSACARKVLPKEGLFSFAETGLGVKEILGNYLAGLDAYARWYLLPPEYKEMDFSTTKERFYNIKTQVKKRKDILLVNFILPDNYPYAKDFSYCIARMNEKEIAFSDGKRVWFAGT